MSTMRLCAASRPVRSLPDSSNRSPDFHVAISAFVRVSRFTRLLAAKSSVSCGQSESEGGSSFAGPRPSSTKCTWRVAAQLGSSATGFDAAWVAYSLTFTSRTVDNPPRPCAPMPSAFTFSNSSRRSSSPCVFAPRARSSWMLMGSIIPHFAISIAFSGDPPMPSESNPGGHQSAPMVGTSARTQSTIESDGRRQANFDLFSEPPPFAATITSTSSPGTSSTCVTAGVLSPVLRRLPSGSASIEARSGLSLSV